MSNTAIILGAGSGSRMKSQTNKMLLEIMGKTVLERSVEAFLAVKEVDEIIVTAREQELEAYIALFENEDKVSFVIGGDTRQQSVRNAVETVDEAELIIIHDGARPLIRQQEIEATIAAAKKYKAAAVGVPVKDTIKVLDSKGFVRMTPDRSRLFAVQTPQVFNFEIYQEAMRRVEKSGADYTDDCQLIEAAGGKVKMVTGDYSNIKITTPEDIALAESILLQRLKRSTV
ncbi:MAG: 2-C-methyl-D-erythritol 4-phosphate cytidylyltransferase [Eubacterium sp.]|nr:2-C-methyl-D-erythritol 4-phosphate cytidylyltransferase [Eubacterium sp.]